MEFLYLRWKQMCLKNGMDILVNIKSWSLADVETCSFSVFDIALHFLGAGWAVTQQLSVVRGLYSVMLKNVVSHMAESIILKTPERKK